VPHERQDRGQARSGLGETLRLTLPSCAPPAGEAPWGFNDLPKNLLARKEICNI
jgi:hypothetical protein